MHKAEGAVENDLGKAEVLVLLENLKPTALFMAEASIDLIKILAKVMLNAVTVRRALWLMPLVADPASKQGWCRIPFDVHSLFGINWTQPSQSRLVGNLDLSSRISGYFIRKTQPSHTWQDLEAETPSPTGQEGSFACNGQIL